MRLYIANVEVKWLAFFKAGPVQQYSYRHTAPIVAPTFLESLEQEFFKSVLWKFWFLVFANLGALGTSCVTRLAGFAWVIGPRMTQEGFAPPILIGALVNSFVVGVAFVFWIKALSTESLPSHINVFVVGSFLCQPVKEVA